MIDQEKVIHELENVGAWHTHHYNQLHYEYAETIHNAIALLKEQDEQIKEKDETINNLIEQIKDLGN